MQADDFIDKPFDTQQMREKVKKLVAQTGGRAAVAPARPVAVAAAAPARPAPIPRTPPPAMPPPPAVARPPAPSMGRGSAQQSAPPVPGNVAQALASNGAALRERLEDLDLTREQVQAVLALSRDVIERVVWEVVPVLAETLIKEVIQRLTRE